jgi:hypothetical protein
MRHAYHFPTLECYRATVSSFSEVPTIDAIAAQWAMMRARRLLRRPRTGANSGSTAPQRRPGLGRQRRLCHQPGRPDSCSTPTFAPQKVARMSTGSPQPDPRWPVTSCASSMPRTVSTATPGRPRRGRAISGRASRRLGGPRPSGAAPDRMKKLARAASTLRTTRFRTLSRTTVSGSRSAHTPEASAP